VLVAALLRAMAGLSGAKLIKISFAAKFSAIFQLSADEESCEFMRPY
jgi:hypothetical protein